MDLEQQNSAGSPERRSSSQDQGKIQYLVPAAVNGLFPQVGGYNQALYYPRSEFSLASILNVIFRFRYLILALTVISIATSYYIYQQHEPSYSSSVTVSISRYISPINGPTGQLLASESTRDIGVLLPLLSTAVIAELALTQDTELAAYVKDGTLPENYKKEPQKAAQAPEISLTTRLQDENATEANTPPSSSKHGDASSTSSATAPVTTNKPSPGLIAKYLSRVSYEQTTKGSLVTIRANAADPLMATRLAHAQANAFIALVRASLLDNARVNLAFLKKRKDEAAKRATETRKAVVEFAEANSLMISSESKDVSGLENQNIGNRLWFLTSALISVTSARTQAEAKYRQLRDLGSSNIAKFGGDSAFQMNLAEKTADYKTLKKAGVSKSAPIMRKLEFEIDNLKNAIVASREGEVRNAQISYQTLRDQETLIQEEFKKLQRESVQQARTLVRFRLLKEEDISAQSSLKELTERLDEVYIHLSNNQKHVRLFDTPQIPTSANVARNNLTLFIGCLLGPLVGVGLAFAIDLLDNTVRTPKDLRNVIQVPLLGVIPRFSRAVDEIVSTTHSLGDSSGLDDLQMPEIKEDIPFFDSPLEPLTATDPPQKSEQLFQPWTSDLAPGGPIATSATKIMEPMNYLPMLPKTTEPNAAKSSTRPTTMSTADMESFALDPTEPEQTPRPGTITMHANSSLVFLSAPHSGESEAFRSVRTMINYSGEESPKTLLITSSSPNDGKSTVACNLALSLAMDGKTTLLLDADMRIPSIHNYFNISGNTPGLSDYLQGFRSNGEVICETPIPGLFLLLAGETPANPAELLGSRRMKELLEVLEDDFDHIVIDSPPVSQLSDTVLLSRLVNAVIFVVRSGKTPIPTLESAVSRLRQVRARIFGAVLNDVVDYTSYDTMDYYYVTETDSSSKH